MKRTTYLMTAVLAAGFAGFGCEHDHDSSASSSATPARGEAMQATAPPGEGAKHSSGVSSAGTTTGNATTGSPTAPQITTAAPTASSDTARAELHAKDASPAAAPAKIAATPPAVSTETAAKTETPAKDASAPADVSGQAQLAAAEDKADKDAKDEKHHADAVAHVKPAGGAPKDMQVTGSVKFFKEEHGLKVVVNLKGLKPDSKHGFHIHEKDDLSSPDLKSAGGHFNPGGKKHGGPEGDERHGGDLGNLTADDKGNVKAEIMAHGITIDGEKDGVIGRSVIVHEKADDMKTDPAGDSGSRIAGGAIEKPKPKAEKEKASAEPKAGDAQPAAATIAPTEAKVEEAKPVELNK